MPFLSCVSPRRRKVKRNTKYTFLCIKQLTFTEEQNFSFCIELIQRKIKHQKGAAEKWGSRRNCCYTWAVTDFINI